MIFSKYSSNELKRMGRGGGSKNRLRNLNFVVLSYVIIKKSKLKSTFFAY